MKTNFLTFLAVMLLCFGVNAQPSHQNFGKNDGREKMGDKFRRAFAEMKLSDQQIESMRAIEVKIQQETKSFRDELRELRAKQQTLTTSEKADIGAINQNIEKMGALRVGAAKVLAKYHQEMRGLLTNEQRITFDSHSEKMGENWRHGRFNRK